MTAEIWKRPIKSIEPRSMIDALAVVFSFYGSYWICSKALPAGMQSRTVYLAILVAVIARLTSFKLFRLYDHIWKFTSIYDAMQLFKAVIFSSIAITAIAAWAFKDVAPFEFLIVDTLLLGFSVSALRLGRRFHHEKRLSAWAHKNGKRTLIYGAGTPGKALANWLNANHLLGSRPVGFIDDDPELQGGIIGGLKVLGTRQDLSKVIKDYGVQELIVATKSISGDALREVLQCAHSFRLRPRLLTDFGSNMPASAEKNTILRDAELEDLLKRPKVAVDLESVKNLVQEETVLITGAGGSIGSELARQVARLNPKQLLILDHSEYNLYKIEQELASSAHSGTKVVPLLLDLKEKRLIDGIVDTYKPTVVYHAAAYKHVHLVEANPCAAIINNIQGTRTLVDACERVGTEVFVLISSDKAVNPVGVMGSTKRACELVVKHAAQRTGKRFCAVRFGNVLGSSGSLIPLLRKQIRNGGPVTITHPDMARYFMLISEAVSLVLKASSRSKPGDINILRMGEPVKIVDIATSLITLLGRRVEDVSIIFTGIRPGEKLCEELYICGDELETDHQEILVLPDRNSDYSEVGPKVEFIIGMAAQGRTDSVRALNALVEAHARTQAAA